MANVDLAVPKKKEKAMFDPNALRLLPDTNKIHSRLFEAQPAGDGPKGQNDYQKPKRAVQVVKKSDHKARNATRKMTAEQILEGYKKTLSADKIKALSRSANLIFSNSTGQLSNIQVAPRDNFLAPV